jgi:Undecaprenyl-phosphate galactose phosphotransferase WbaP
MVINNKTIKEISRFALIISDTLSVVIPALCIYTFFDKIENQIYPRLNTIGGVAVFAISILFWSQTLYEQYTIRRSFYDEFKELLHIFMFNGLSALAALFFFGFSTDKNKHLIFLFIVFSLIPIFREITRILLDRLGLWRIQCVVFCPRSEFKYVKAAIESQFNLGMEVRRSSAENWIIRRIIRNHEEMDRILAEINKINILKYYSKIGSPHIVLFAHRKNAENFPKVVEIIYHCELPHSIIPDIGGISLLGARASHFFRWELLLITPKNNIGRVSFRILKRLFDFIISLILIILLFLPMLVICLIIMIEGESIFYLHERLGMGGKKFKCFKFRTMYSNSDMILKEYFIKHPIARNEWLQAYKLHDDPRITKLGIILRKYSLDELPQLFNVLIGHMSLVGPRPIVVEEVEKYGFDLEMYYKVRPGMTGLWQISGRSNTTYDYRVAMDIWYIKNWSFWYDLGILIRTIGVVLSKVGAK